MQMIIKTDNAVTEVEW